MSVSFSYSNDFAGMYLYLCVERLVNGGTADS